MSIKNVIFDLGGVILNIDYQLTIKAFNNLGAANFQFAYSEHNQKTLFDNFEVGRIAPEDFRKKLKEQYNLNISDQEFDEAWNAMLLDIPIEKIEFIKNLRLQQDIKTFLLSNTNTIHFQAFHSQHGHEVFSECFNKEYYSYQVGKRKPNPEAFLMILSENNLLPEQTLFLDDINQNVESARTVGLHAELITETLTIFNTLDIMQKCNTK